MIKVLSWACKLIGATLVFLGAQTWGFHNFVAPHIEIANVNLLALLEEAPAHSLIDATLITLRDYRHANDDEIQSRQILGLRETIVRGYRADPRAVIDEALRISAGLNGHTDVEQELLATLRRNLLRLQAMYADHYAEVIARY